MTDHMRPETDAGRPRRVLIVCQLDSFANGVKPRALEHFLRSRGHDVTLLDTYSLSRASTVFGSPLRKLPRPRLRHVALYATEAANRVLTQRFAPIRRCFTYYVAQAYIRLRRRILGTTLALDEFDLVICEHPHDAGLLELKTSATTLYDCPTPFADELMYEGQLTKRQHAKFRRSESQLFEQVDALSFGWESYARYAKEEYGISGNNLLQLNWGCNLSDRRAHFADPPRVVYLGSLSSKFIDLALLARLGQLYPHIDVNGGPPPPDSLNLNFRGWAPPSVLESYQFGLITCTQDELRRSGFSAKHLDYLSYGLPVLVPVWRRHLDLLQGSIPYDEMSFVSVIDSLSCEKEWQRASDDAYEQAKRLTWDRTLRPLDDLLGPGRQTRRP